MPLIILYNNCGFKYFYSLYALKVLHVKALKIAKVDSEKVKEIYFKYQRKGLYSIL